MKQILAFSLLLATISICFALRPVEALAYGCSFTDTRDNTPACIRISEDTDLDSATAEATCTRECGALSWCNTFEVVEKCPVQFKAPKKDLINPIGGTPDQPKGTVNISAITGSVIQAVVGIVGALTFLVFVYGGFLWLTSAGSEEKVTAGTQTMLWAAIGLAIIFASYALLSTIIGGIAVTG